MANLDLTTIEGIEKAKKHWKAEERERIIEIIINELKDIKNGEPTAWAFGYEDCLKNILEKLREANV